MSNYDKCVYLLFQLGRATMAILGIICICKGNIQMATMDFVLCVVCTQEIDKFKI